MSFRYTNNLIHALRHRLLMESAQREISGRHFIGEHRGVRATCSGFGAILSIQFQKGQPPVEGQSIEDLYYEPGVGEGPRRLRLELVADSVRAAVWAAQQQRRAAKMDAVHRSLQRVEGGMGGRALRHWYEEDPDVLSGLMPHHHLTKWCGTPWMQAAQHGVPPPAEDEGDGGVNSLQKVLASACDPLRIPIGSLHPLRTPALLHFERPAAPVASPPVSPAAQVSDRQFTARSGICPTALRQAQRKELRRDEQRFWDRVELIQRAQMASSAEQKTGSDKRGYKELAALRKTDDVLDKVELRFTQ